MVSFWICIRAALFDLFSTAGFPKAEGRPGLPLGGGGEAAKGGADCVEAEDDVVEEVEADTVDGSAVIRSIRVVPDESYTIPFLSKLTQKKEQMLK